MSRVLKTLTVNGQKFEIFVSPDGVFSARGAGEWLSDETLKGLLAKIRKSAKRIKIVVAVPVTVLGRQLSTPRYSRHKWISGHGVQHITLTGIHGKYECAMYRDDVLPDDRGLTSDLRSGYRDHEQFVRRLTDDEAAEFKRLSLAAEAAKEALHAFVGLRKVDPDELAKAAIAEKIDTPDDPAEQDEDPRL